MDNANATNTEHFSDLPPVIEKPIGAIAEAIHQRILTEQQKLHAEENAERELTTKRIALLTDGTDKDVDTCEMAIDQSRTSQLRCLERIELLAEQLKQANKTAEKKRLEDIAAGAERARQRGITIINKVYPKLAKQLADALAELKECELTIFSANHELTVAKHADLSVDTPNASRGPLEPLHESVNLPSELADGSSFWAANQGRLDAIRNSFMAR